MGTRSCICLVRRSGRLALAMHALAQGRAQGGKAQRAKKVRGLRYASVMCMAISMPTYRVPEGEAAFRILVRGQLWWSLAGRSTLMRMLVNGVCHAFGDQFINTPAHVWCTSTTTS